MGAPVNLAFQRLPRSGSHPSAASCLRRSKSLSFRFAACRIVSFPGYSGPARRRNDDLGNSRQVKAVVGRHPIRKNGIGSTLLSHVHYGPKVELEAIQSLA
jgi:hypothetical protein